MVYSIWMTIMFKNLKSCRATNVYYQNRHTKTAKSIWGKLPEGVEAWFLTIQKLVNRQSKNWKNLVSNAVLKRWINYKGEEDSRNAGLKCRLFSYLIIKITNLLIKKNWKCIIHVGWAMVGWNLSVKSYGNFFQFKTTLYNNNWKKSM